MSIDTNNNGNNNNHHLITASHSAITHVPKALVEEGTAAMVRDFLAMGFRHRRLVVVSFLMIVALSIAYPCILPTYESEAKILVTHERAPDPVQTADEKTVYAQDVVTEEELNSELELIQSKDLLRQVVVQCGLQHPNTWMAKVRATISRLLHPLHPLTEEEKIYKTTRALSDELTVEALPKTNIIHIAYKAHDLNVAARVVKLITTLYLEKHLAVHRPQGQVEFFTHESARYMTDLLRTENALAAFSKKQSVAPELQLSSQGGVLQKLTDFKASLAQTRSEIAATQQRIQSLQRQATAIPSRQTTALRKADNPELMQSLQATLLSLQLKRTELLTKFQSNYRPVVELEKQISDTRAAIQAAEAHPTRDETTDVNPAQQWVFQELEKARADLKTSIARADALNQIVQKYDVETRTLDRQSLHHEDLVRDQKVNEANYLLYVQKREEARISDALDAKRVLNVSIAEPPTVPLLPKHSNLLYALAGVLLATIMSTGLVATMELLDRSFRTPHEVESYLDIPVLASLPAAELSNANLNLLAVDQLAE